MRMRMETPIIPPAIPSTNSGLTLIPLVSSSKNRSNPALEAGSGAFFFLLLLIATVWRTLTRLNRLRLQSEIWYGSFEHGSTYSKPREGYLKSLTIHSHQARLKSKNWGNIYQ